MNKILPLHRAREYVTITVLLGIIFVSGLISVVAEDDLLLILGIGAVIIFALFYIKNVEPVHLLYALCLGVSFLPYINLQMFPVSGIYVVALLLVACTLISFIGGKQPLNISPQAKWMAAFLGIGILSMIAAPDKKASVIYGIQFFLYICVYIVSANILDTKPKIVQALKYVIYGSIVPIMLSIVQLAISLVSIGKVVDVFFETVIGELFIGTKGIERIGDSAALILNRGSNVAESSDLVLFRVFGTFEGPTIFGWYLLVITLLVGGMYVVQFGKKRVGLHKFSNAVLFLFLISCLILTWTRSALLAFLVAFVFLLIYRNKTSVRIFTPKVVQALAIIITLPLIILGFLMLFQVPLPTESFARFSFQRLGGSAIARLLTILFAVSYIIQNPIIGIGMGNYKYVQPGVDANAAGASFASAHNTYLELGVEFGLPGLIIFILILRSFMKQAAVLVRATVGSFYHTLGIIFIGIWIGFALVSFFGGNLIHPRFMTLLWVLAGIQTASYHLYLNDKKKENTVYRLEVAD